MQKFFLAIVVVLGLVLTTGIGTGQATNGTIRGVVRDTSKAVLPGVPVELTNVETKATLKSLSNASGEYKFEVPRGVYEITASLSGFSVLKVPNVRLSPNETIQKELTLTVAPRKPLSKDTQGQWIPIEK